MKVRELIDRLLDQPMNNTVYVGDISHGVNERGWDGELQEVVGDGPGVFATFLGFNETGLNNYMNTEVRDDPDQVPGRTITDSELETITHDLATYEGPVLGTRIRVHLAHIGVSVVPDPEPTNAEKLEADLREYDPLLRLTTSQLASTLDRLGWVKAPGGDDECGC